MNMAYTYKYFKLNDKIKTNYFCGIFNSRKTVICLAFFAILSMYYCYRSEIHQFSQETIFSRLHLNLFNEPGISGKRVLVVDTSGCKIPLSDLVPPFYKNNWNWSEADNIVPDCHLHTHFIPFVELDEVIKVTYPNIESCSLREIIRDPLLVNDFSFAEINRINLTSRYVNVSEMESFVVECDGKFNMEATIPIKPQVQMKIDFWNGAPKAEAESRKEPLAKNNVDLPINILWVVLDSVSRRHLQRSFVKTLKVMEEMDFIDFQGFHSIAPYTYNNFLPFVLGTSFHGTDCEDPVIDTYDNCSFIWKEFARQNYVTMHLEDLWGTLNYAEHDGNFVRRPVDYYLHPFYLAQMKYFWYKDSVQSCVSNETSVQFTLRYTKRFIEKFYPSNNTRRTPFFSFVWINSPFHDYKFGLPNTDADFEKFFLFLQNESELLKNTLIMLTSDHGDRFSLFQSSSYHALLERSLPPLFIRIPENLMEKHPELKLKEMALKNSKMLTTAYDVYHTLLHVLHLSGFSTLNSNLTEEFEFQPILPDRTSLLAQMFENRTCDSVNIEEEYCKCNLFLDGVHLLENPQEIDRLIDHAVTELNDKRESSTFYEENCEKWNYDSKKALISARILEEAGNFSVVNLQFETEPFAKFEIQIRIIQEETRFDSLVTEGRSLSRITSYGNSSWCVEVEDVGDKIMKEYCICKNSTSTPSTTTEALSKEDTE